MKRADARVLVVGCGGLGTPALIALAEAGIGTLGLADDDVVDASNLHRQILFDEADVGRPKTKVVQEKLAEHPRRERGIGGLRVVDHASRLVPSNALEVVAAYDLVLEGSDNFATKFLTADACALAKVPVVHGAAVRWHGTALAVGSEGRPCYRCVFEDIPTEQAPNCAEAGVLGPVVGIVAALQVDLALALLDGKDVQGTLLSFDGRSDGFRRRTVGRRTTCSLCGPSREDFRITDSRYAAETNVCNF